MNRMLDVVLNVNVILCIMFSIIIILFIILKNQKKEQYIFILSMISFIAGIVHFFLYNFHRLEIMLFYFKQIYIIAILIFIISFLRDRKKVFSYLCYILLIFSIVCTFRTIYLMAGADSIHNYSYYGYEKSFSRMIDTLENEYPLNDWKNINYSYLRNKYIPMVEDAEKNKDKVLFYETVFMFANEFKDGHVAVSYKNDDAMDKLNEKYYGKYYGFATIMADNGDIVAIMVDEKSDVYQKGLRNGYIITKKDGKDISDILENEFCLNIQSYAVNYNEKLSCSTTLFSNGKDSIDISFLNDYGEEITINVKSQDEYNLKYYSPEYYLLYSNDTNNLDTKMLTDEIGYININSMNYSSFCDTINYIFHNNYAKKSLIKKLDQLKKQGMKKLIIDLRDNSGGFLVNSFAFASTFLDKTFVFNTKSIGKITGIYDNDSIKGTGEYSDIPIIILVNNNTASAADAFTYLLKMNSKVKVVGFMPSNNSCQETGGEVYLSHGISVSYPRHKVEMSNGEVFIDTKKDGIERIKLDIKIPITKDNIMEIFDYANDYVLDYAISIFK